jgi:hypothetical protein
MRYFTNNRAIEDGQEFLIEADWVEIETPVRSDGTYYKQHKNIDKLAKDSDGNYYEYYNLTPDENGIFQPDYIPLKPNLIEEFEAYYDSDEFRLVNIDGHDVPNRSWLRDLAKEGVVAYEDKVSNGEIGRDDELPIAWKINGEKISLTYSFLCTVSEDLTRMINVLYIKKDDLCDELELSTDDSYISSWLENSKAELDNLKATL